MTKLTTEDVLKVARLARIELSTDEQSKMTADVGSILGFVDDLQKIDTKSIEPTSQVTGLKDVWREDRVVDCTIDREQLMSQAPEIQDGYVKVKKVL